MDLAVWILMYNNVITNNLLFKVKQLTKTYCIFMANKPLAVMYV